MKKKQPLTVHVGTVTHEYGSTAYVARTEDGLYAKLAEFCREWWEEAYPDETQPAADLTDREIVESYFDAMGENGEGLDINIAELED